MNQAFYYLSLAGFLVLPALLLGTRFAFPDKFPLWAALIAIPLGSWIFANATVYFYFEYICEPIRYAWNPPEDELARCVNDGAKRVFALYFGWIYGLVYSVPFAVFFFAASWIRNRRRAKTAHAI